MNEVIVTCHKCIEADTPKGDGIPEKPEKCSWCGYPKHWLRVSWNMKAWVCCRCHPAYGCIKEIRSIEFPAVTKQQIAGVDRVKRNKSRRVS